MFVDFAGDTVPVTDPETGEIWNAQVFVSVLGASGYLYVEATRSQDLASWLGAHVRAVEFYGGAARAVVPDNLKSGVTVASWYEPELNPSYLEWARTYAVAILSARPYRPRDKACASGLHLVGHLAPEPRSNRAYWRAGSDNCDRRLDIMAFQEFQIEHVPMSSMPVPLWERWCAWLIPAYRQANVEMNMGLRLRQMF